MTAKILSISPSTTSTTSTSTSTSIDSLDNGPLRFHPKNESTIEEQLTNLEPHQLQCVQTLKKKWESQPVVPFPLDDAMYLRFARCSPGKDKFNVKTAWGVMKKFDKRYLHLTAAGLEGQLLTKTLFIPPGLYDKDGHEMFYMRPSRYFPKETPTQLIIDNLAYCMGVMQEKEKSSTDGIGFLANMNGWDFSNFSVSYCLAFMKMLQGRIPVRVRLFLIVDPPSWFGKIWSIMKPMLAADFRKKVHMIPAGELKKYLAKGFEQHLPNELGNGVVDVDEAVADFIEYRKTVEVVKL